MKKIALAAAMALALGGTAKADMFDYGELFGGITMEPSLSSDGIDLDMTTGFNVGGALGWNLSPDFSLEIEGFYTQSNYDAQPFFSTDLETFSFMANAYWSFDCGWTGVRPYLGAGVGGIQMTIADGTSVGLPFVGGSEVVFGYQGMAGVVIPVDTNIDIVAEYRYQGASDADIEITYAGLGPATITQEYKSHNVSAGFRFHL